MALNRLSIYQDKQLQKAQKSLIVATPILSVLIGLLSTTSLHIVVSVLSLLVLTWIFYAKPTVWVFVWLLVEGGIFNLNQHGVVSVSGKLIYVNQALFILGFILSLLYVVRKRFNGTFQLPTDIRALLFIGVIILGIYTLIGLENNVTQLVLQDFRRIMYYGSILVFIAIIKMTDGKEALLRTWRVASVILAIAAIASYLTHTTLLLNTGTRGGAEFAVRTPGMEIIVMPWVYSLSALVMRQFKLLTFLETLILTLGLFTNLSRTDVVSMALAFLLVTSIQLVRLKFHRIFPLVGTSIVVVGIVALNGALVRRILSVTSGSLFAGGSLSSTSVLVRVTEYEQGIHHLLVYPFGTGIGTTLPEYGAFSDIGYVWVTMNLGIVGLLWLLWLIAEVLYHAYTKKQVSWVFVSLFLMVDLTRGFASPVFYAYGSPLSLGLLLSLVGSRKMLPRTAKRYQLWSPERGDISESQGAVGV